MQSTSTLSLCLLLAASALAANNADRLTAPVAREMNTQPGPRVDVIPAQAPVLLATPKLLSRDTDTIDITEIGTTHYDYQANGSQSKMLAVSSDGTVHGVFMGGTDIDANRRVKVWCLDTEGTLTAPTNMLNTKTGYPTIDVTSAAPSNGLVANSSIAACHNDNYPWIGVDFDGCTMAFNNLALPCGNNVYWPHVAVDNQDRIHVVCYQEEGPERYYIRSSDGQSWDAGGCSLISENSESLGSIVTASATTDKVAVLAFRCFDIPFDGGDEHVGSQMHHDIWLYESESGDIASEISEGKRTQSDTLSRSGQHNHPLP